MLGCWCLCVTRTKPERRLAPQTHVFVCVGGHVQELVSVWAAHYEIAEAWLACAGGVGQLLKCSVGDIYPTCLWPGDVVLK